MKKKDQRVNLTEVKVSTLRQAILSVLDNCVFISSTALPYHVADALGAGKPLTVQLNAMEVNYVNGTAKRMTEEGLLVYVARNGRGPDNRIISHKTSTFFSLARWKKEVEAYHQREMEKARREGKHIAAQMDVERRLRTLSKDLRLKENLVNLMQECDILLEDWQKILACLESRG